MDIFSRKLFQFKVGREVGTYLGIGCRMIFSFLIHYNQLEALLFMIFKLKTPHSSP